MGSAVLRVIVKAGAGNAGDTDFLDKIFGESDVFRFGGEARIGFWKMEAGDVGHDVVSAARFEYSETGGGKNFEKALTFGRVGGSEGVVVGLRRAKRHGSGLLQRRCRANR